jgi:hypothetical protein
MVHTVTIWMERSSIRTACQNLRSFRIAFQTRKQLTFRMPKSAVLTRVPETQILTRLRTYKAYK